MALGRTRTTVPSSLKNLQYPVNIPGFTLPSDRLFVRDRQWFRKILTVAIVVWYTDGLCHDHGVVDAVRRNAQFDEDIVENRFLRRSFPVG